MITGEYKEIAELVGLAYDQLNWRIDDGLYYKSATNVGEGYAKHNMHGELVGSQNSFLSAKDFTLGIFVLGSNVFLS